MFHLYRESLNNYMKHITIAKGDGIGPEIMEAVWEIIEAAGVELGFDEIQIGEQAYLAGDSSGISSESWASIRKNKGIKVWPNGFEETFCTDHWRCRFESTEGHNINKRDIIELLQNAENQGIDTIKTENLYAFNGQPAFSLGQGQ